MEKICGRCQNTLVCNVNDIANCDCTQVQLSAHTRQYLDKTEYDCLCNNCLAQLNDMVAQSQRMPFPKQGQGLQQNVHYYMENGLLVFSEFYHLSRGYCCGNGCRHCAYK